MVEVWSFLKLPIFKTEMYSFSIQTAAFNSIQRQKSQCSTPSPIRFLSLFGAFFKRSVQTWQSTDRAGPLLSGNLHVPYLLQRLSFGFPLAVVFDVGIILTMPVLSQDGDCYSSTEQLWETGLIESRRSMWSEQNRLGKKTHTLCTTISSDEQLRLKGVKRTCREGMGWWRNTFCIFWAESVWRSSLWTLQLNTDGLQIIN